MAVGGRIAGGPQIEVGRKLVVHPRDHGLAKAADHDAHRRHHGDGRRQRATSTDVRRSDPRQAARGKQRLHAHDAAQRGGRSCRAPVNERRNGQRRCADQQNSRQVAEQRLALHGGQARGHRRSRRKHNRDQRIAFAFHANRQIHAGRAPWLRSAGPSRPPAPAQTPRQLRRRCRPQPRARPTRPTGRASRAGSRHTAHRQSRPAAAPRRGKQPSQRNRDGRPHSSEQCGFGQKSRQHGAPARAQRAHGSDLGTPPHHRNRDCVVDEECAHQKRDVAEDAQIPAKRSEHAAIRGWSGCPAG